MSAPALSISTTGISDAAKCLKAYEYHFRDRLISRPENISKAVRRGVWLHRTLQDHHCGREWQKSLAKLMGQGLSWNLDGDMLQEIYDETRLLMLGYVAYYKEDNWRPIADEQEYRATFGGVELRATIDLLAEVPHHGNVLVEYKSTADIPPSAWRAVDPQTAMQIILLAANGIKVDEVLFDYLDTTPKVPRITEKHEFHKITGVTTSAHFDEAAAGLWAKVRALPNSGIDKDEPSDAFTPDFKQYILDKRGELVDDAKFFQRFWVSRQPELLVETIKDLAGIADRVLRAEAAGHFPRSLNVYQCKSCFYNFAALCPTEYVKGGTSEVLRSEQFQPDTGYREGNVA